MKNKFGWFSQKMSDTCGHALYLDTHGQLVKVTSAIDSDPTHIKFHKGKLSDGDTNPHTRWGDEVFVGTVVEFVSSNFYSDCK